MQRHKRENNADYFCDAKRETNVADLCAAKTRAQGEIVTITVMNMNKQPGLYNNDYRPLTRSLPSQRAWSRTSFPASHMSSPAPSGGPPNFELTFRHRFAHDGEDVYFAFCYPHSYDECQELQRSAVRPSGHILSHFGSYYGK